MTRIQEKTILCFAGNDWWVHNPYTEKQWMSLIQKYGYRILFVNSIGIGMPALTTPRVGKRVLNKLKSMSRWVQKSNQGVWVMTPVFLPFWSVRIVQWVNVALVTLQLRLVMKAIGMSRPVFWAGLPTAVLFQTRIRHSKTVYYVQDNFLEYYPAMTFSKTKEHHYAMLNAADQVICASLGMYEKIRTEHDCVEYISHGIPDQFLVEDIVSLPSPPKELRNITHPIIGYWGSLEGLQDPELIDYLAQSRPGWSFVFIGKPMYDISRFRGRANVHFLGYMDLNTIPSYGKYFDVGIISWVQNEYVRYGNPVKYREYLALGLPVVAPDIIEIDRTFPGNAYIARTYEEFLKKIEDVISTDSMDARLQRRELVKTETWSFSAQKVMEIIESSVDQKVLAE